jgi:hypothetical protein
VPPQAIAYVDGFNLYHGALKDTPFRWLDLVSLMDDLLRGHEISKVKYFTARVSDRPGNPGQRRRQEVYLRALRAHCGDRLDVVFGRFATRRSWMPLVKPGSGSRFVQVYRTEEKGSDVNLASQLVWDACHEDFEVAAVVSNDSDLQMPLDMAQVLGISVVTMNPHFRRQQQNLFGTTTRRLTTGRLSRNLLPDPVVENAVVEIGCPHEWASERAPTRR